MVKLISGLCCEQAHYITNGILDFMYMMRAWYHEIYFFIGFKYQKCHK